MPIFHVQDQVTGRVMSLEGDTPPTDEEASQLFQQHGLLETPQVSPAFPQAPIRVGSSDIPSPQLVNPQYDLAPLAGRGAIPPKPTPESFIEGYVNQTAFPVPVLQAPPSSGPIGAFDAGVLNTAGGALRFLGTPLGITTLGLGSIPGMAKLLGPLFGVQQARQAGTQLGEASVTGDVQKATEGTLSALAAPVATMAPYVQRIKPQEILEPDAIFPPKREREGVRQQPRRLEDKPIDVEIVKEEGQRQLTSSPQQKQLAAPSTSTSSSKPSLSDELTKQGYDVKDWEFMPGQRRLQVSFLKDENKDVQGGTVYISPDATLEEAQQQIAAKKSAFETAAKLNPSKQVEKAEEKKQKEKGMYYLQGPDVLKGEFGKGTKVSGQQIGNRLKNLTSIGELSAGELEEYKKKGLDEFLKEPRSTDEVGKWMQENGSRVEVRKFIAGQGKQQRQEIVDVERRRNAALHQVETSGYTQTDTGTLTKGSIEYVHQGDAIYEYRYDERLGERKLIGNQPLGNYPPDFQNYFKANREYERLAIGSEPGEDTHWQSIAPKPENEMPGYVEWAVTKPLDKRLFIKNEGPVDAPQFPSSHSFPPNTLGFGRGYMETLPNGKKVFHVIEVQSDWAQRRRDYEGFTRNEQLGMLSQDVTPTDPLLPHYERLVLKAAIDHAREQGADSIALSDAETAMMTEGHDRNLRDLQNEIEDRINHPNFGGRRTKEELEIMRPSQEKGMRLHYDQILPKILSELTGIKGERVEFGEHKMAFNEPRYMNPETQDTPGRTNARKDLIFRNPDSTPKTSISARTYPLSNTPKSFSLYGKDIYKQPKPKPLVPSKKKGGESLASTSTTPKQKVQTQEEKENALRSAVSDVKKGGDTSMPKAGGTATAPPAISPIRRTTGESAFIDFSPLQDFYDKSLNSIRTHKNKQDIARFKDAADTKANIFAQQARKGVESHAKVLFKQDYKKALSAVNAAIETGGDFTKLDDFISIATKYKDPRGLEAATFAKANWEKLRPLVDRVDAIHAAELQQEQFHNIDVDPREAYIKHAYDLTKIPGHFADKFFSSSSSTSGGRGFLKMRTFKTNYDAIAAGYGKAILSWDVAELVESRLRSGQHMINDSLWLEGLKTLKEPTTGKQVVTDLVKKKNPKTGDVEYNAPIGYTKWTAYPGRAVAVHRGYERLLNSVTASSAIIDFEIYGLPVGKGLLTGASRLKHMFFLFDAYHASKIIAKGMSLKGTPTYNKGLALLEYNDIDLANAVKAGDITQDMANYAKGKRHVAELLINNGYNVARIGEQLTDRLKKGIPFLGGANDWIFQKLTRGVMLQSGVSEFERIRASNKNLSDQEVAAKVAKDLNFNFGNIGRQGLLKSKTMQDFSQFIFFAPQWFESMAQTELRSMGQAAKIPFTGKVGSLAKGTGTLVAAMFVITQLLNLAFKHKPTWKNEDSKHKLDAWVPGGKDGFYISPLSMPMELTHDMYRYIEGGKNPREAVAQIFANKYSPFFRSVETLRTGKDYAGNKLSEEDVYKTAGENLLPIPLAIQAGLKKGGSVERQLLASAGIKAEPAYPTFEEKLEKASQEVYSKPYTKLDLYERADVQKKMDSESEKSTNDAGKLSATERAVEKGLERQKTVRGLLSKESQRFLKDNKVDVTGYQEELTINGTKVYLTDKEKEFYQQQIVSKYEEKISELSQDKDFSTQEQTVKETQLRRNLHQARTEAVSELKQAIESGSILEQDQKKEERKRYTIE